MKLKVKITPNAERNEIIGWFGDQLKIKIAAVPEKGKANQELINFLSSEIDLPKNFIDIVHGHNSAVKLLELQGICKEDLDQRLDIKQIQVSLL